MGGGYERGGGKKGGKRARGGHAIECLNGWGHEGRARGPLGLARWVVGYVIGFCGAVSAGLAVRAAPVRCAVRARTESISDTQSRCGSPALSVAAWPRRGSRWRSGWAHMGNGVRAVRQCCAHHYSHLCPDVFRRRLTGNCVCLVCVPARPGVFEHARAASAHVSERASER